MIITPAKLSFSVILLLVQFAREHLCFSRLGIRYRSCPFSANDAMHRSPAKKAVASNSRKLNCLKIPRKILILRGL